MHVAWFGRVEFREARLDIGRRHSIFVAVHEAKRLRWTASQLIHQRRCDRLGDVELADFLQAAPRGHAIDLSILGGLDGDDDVDAGDRGPDGASRGDREAFDLISGATAMGWPPCLTLVIHVEARRIIATITRSRMTNSRKSLKPWLPFDRTVADSKRRPYFPAEVFRLRSRRKPFPWAPNSGLKTSGPRDASPRPGRADFHRLHRPGLRRRHARAREQKTCHRLVDAGFDGARIIPDDDAEFRQPAQDAEAFCDRLERARGDRADVYGVGQLYPSPAETIRLCFAC